MKRYALIYAPAASIRSYLPHNYTVAHEFDADEVARTRVGLTNAKTAVTLVEGRDDAGWTLDAYVLPRLSSGLYFGEEIDLSHPVMKLVPEPQP